jgi:hypothetical protein
VFEWIWYSFGGLTLLYLPFLVWMLWDCYRNETDRLIWILVIWFLSPLGAIVYFFARYLPRGELGAFKTITSRFQTRELKQLRVAALQIGNPYHWIQYADALAERGRTEQAAEAYGEALDREAQNLPALWGRAQCLETLKRPDEALPLVETILQLDPEYRFGDVSLARGRIHTRLEQWSVARDHLTQHVQRWRQPEGLYLLALAEQQTGEVDGARRHLQDLLLDLEASPPAIARKQGSWKRKAKRLLQQL